MHTRRDAAVASQQRRTCSVVHPSDRRRQLPRRTDVRPVLQPGNLLNVYEQTDRPCAGQYRADADHPDRRNRPLRRIADQPHVLPDLRPDQWRSRIGLFRWSSAVLALGTLVGMLNAGLVVALRVHPLIVTLAWARSCKASPCSTPLGPVGKVPAQLQRSRLWAHLQACPSGPRWRYALAS